MTTNEKLLDQARRIAAAAHELNGPVEGYCDFMRQGAYDDDPIIQATLSALTIGERQGRAAAEAEIAAVSA